MSREQPLDIGGAQSSRAHIIAFPAQKIDDLNDAFGSVEPDGITGTPRASWIIRQNEREFALRARGPAQFRRSRGATSPG